MGGMFSGFPVAADTVTPVVVTAAKGAAALGDLARSGSDKIYVSRLHYVTIFAVLLVAIVVGSMSTTDASLFMHSHAPTTSPTHVPSIAPTTKAPTTKSPTLATSAPV
jgi:hypothetical protein